MNHPWTSCLSLSDFLKSTGCPDRQTSPPQQNHNETPTSDEPSCTTESTDHSRGVYPEDPHPNLPHIFGSGSDFIDVFNADQHTEKRRDNIYYPFSSKEEWSLALWLLCSGLLMRAINDFLSLPIVSPLSCVIQSTLAKNKVWQLSLLFATSNTLRPRMEDLPKVPAWKMQDISLTSYKTAKPIVLFYRDPLECIQALLRNPTFEGKWTFSARRVYDDSSQQNHVYSDWMSGDRAWSAQVSTPYSCLFLLT